MATPANGNNAPKAPPKVRKPLTPMSVAVKSMALIERLPDPAQRESAVKKIQALLA